jgi:hypothetical protein
VKTTLFEAAAPAPAALTPRCWNAPPTSTNEERDLERFRAYVTRLGPAALYDVRAHLDPDRFPRRFALVENELAHRRLLPAADRAPADPVWLRRLAGSALALLLGRPAAGGRRCTIFVSGHEHLPFFTDLAAASPDVARLLFPLTLLGFVFCAAVLAGHGAASFFAAVRVRWKRTSAPARRNTACSSPSPSSPSTCFCGACSIDFHP